MILSNMLTGLWDWVPQNKPDLLIIHGNHVEAFAACTVASQLSLCYAHIEGGEVSGSINKIYYHCNTKLSMYHFVSSETVKHHIVSLGEDPRRIFTIGSPELDAHIHGSGVTLGEVKHKYSIPFTKYGIITFHSITSETDTIGEQAQHLFDCLSSSRKRFVVIWPNNDPGTEKIQAIILALDPICFYGVLSLSFDDFSALIKGCKAVIGNSSAGVQETPFLRILSLNVGTQQWNRAEDVPSITHCSAFDTSQIQKFLDSKWGQRFRPHYGFGRGSAAQEFVDALDIAEFWEQDLQKVFYKAH